MSLDLKIICTLFLLGLSLATSFIVISVVSPVYAVLALIALFILSSAVFLIHGIEFLAFIYLLVYVGALLILFLWVVMTMPVKRNLFLHLRLTVLCIMTFMCSLLVFFLIDFTTLKVIRVSPDLSLFSAFIQYLKQNIQFQFFFGFAKDSNIFRTLSSLIPSVLVGQIYAIKINPSNFLYDVYVIYAARHFWMLAPIAPGSAMFENLLSIYNASFSGTTSLEVCLAPQFFLHSVATLNFKSEFISLFDLLNRSTGNFLLLALNKSSAKSFELILPPFVDISNYIFIKPRIYENFFFSFVKK